MHFGRVRVILRSTLCAIAVLSVAGPARASPPLQPFDEIELRDGRRIRGHVVAQEPGQWVVIETEDGRQHTFPWAVVDQLNLAESNVTHPEAARLAWRRRGGGGVSYELRAELAGLLLPNETFGLTGHCATGTALAPASIYGQSARARGHAAGGGTGARVSYMHLFAPDPGRSTTWWGLRAGTGLDLQILYARTPSGIPPFDGQLCSQVATTSHDVVSDSTAAFLVRSPLTFGAHVGLGRFDEPLVWRGVVLGIAWSPSLVVVGPWGADAAHLVPLGIELTVDFTTLHATSAKRRLDSSLRVFVDFAPALTADQLMMGTVGIGAAWY